MQKTMFKSAIGRKSIPFSVITMVRLKEHRVFTVKCFIKTESYVAVQRTFCKKRKLKRHDSVSWCVTISKWVKTFRETSAAVSLKAVVWKRNIRTVDNCKKLRVAVKVTL